MFGEDLVTYTWIGDDCDAWAYRVDEDVYEGPLMEVLWKMVDRVMAFELWAMVKLDVKPPLVSQPEAHVYHGSIIQMRVHKSLQLV